MHKFPTQSRLLLNFSSFSNWEEKYMYIIELGKLLPKFPNNMKTQQYSVIGCQSQTWIGLILAPITTQDNHQTSSSSSIKTILYGDSDSTIIKGILTIIFIAYQYLSIQEIINYNISLFLRKLKLQENLTISRSQGIHFIIKSIQTQAEILYKKQ